jgi:hypothetical protein
MQTKAVELYLWLVSMIMDDVLCHVLFIGSEAYYKALQVSMILVAGCLFIVSCQRQITSVASVD